MHLFVAFSAAMAVAAVCLNPRLRLHGAAVLTSATGWLVLHTVYMRFFPAFIHEGGTMMRFEFYCCPFGLGTLHVLLSVALGVGIIRESMRDQSPPDDAKGPPSPPGGVPPTTFTAPPRSTPDSGDR